MQAIQLKPSSGTRRWKFILNSQAFLTIYNLLKNKISMAYIKLHKKYFFTFTYVLGVLFSEYLYKFALSLFSAGCDTNKPGYQYKKLKNKDLQIITTK
jgi:hypothetical protein